MVKEITKIRAKTSTDDELLKECKEEAKCNTCDSITWTEPAKGTRIDPPPNTVADLIHTRGAIRIYENQGAYVNGVGTEEAGNRVIIP
ncbi:hypothetical protein AJ78_07676 [Emergomyces pasteurianus Ep9510]|uniref:Uncharacterized protein n=1 Tax=Emergomyces pasteurianus Ep9510 TaxID=1447872 RepID=A0A1J9P624_9EURO|nr:hypothetical protein AJ78_07676 [Emergomyces pasteurianus Ep9510]